MCRCQPAAMHKSITISIMDKRDTSLIGAVHAECPLQQEHAFYCDDFSING